MQAIKTSDTRVLKFGGTSVGSPEKIRRVAKIIQEHSKSTPNLVVVVSAMGDTTDHLVSLASQVSPQYDKLEYRREMDMLLSSGERISMALLSLALGDLGVNSVSLTGSQSGIITDSVHGEARIAEIKPTRIPEYFSKKKVVIVAGFQGVSREKEITTLGRGGSDTSAVALGAALNAADVYIYTDVDGFFSADPQKVSKAVLYKKIGWDFAIVAAERGAEVLHPRCVELAAKFGIRLKVLSALESAKNKEGTTVEGFMFEMLEGPKIISVSMQRDLVLYKKANVSQDSVADIKAKLDSAGIRQLHFSYLYGTLSVLVEKSQSTAMDAMLKENSQQEKNLCRLSVVGTGLNRAGPVVQQIEKILAQQAAKTIFNEQSSYALDWVFLDTNNKNKEILEQTHSAFLF